MDGPAADGELDALPAGVEELSDDEIEALLEEGMEEDTEEGMEEGGDD